jgi:hypothetical protein
VIAMSASTGHAVAAGCALLSAVDPHSVQRAAPVLQRRADVVGIDGRLRYRGRSARPARVVGGRDGIHNHPIAATSAWSR